MIDLDGDAATTNGFDKFRRLFESLRPVVVGPPATFPSKKPIQSSSLQSPDIATDHRQDAGSDIRKPVGQRDGPEAVLCASTRRTKLAQVRAASAILVRRSAAYVPPKGE